MASLSLAMIDDEVDRHHDEQTLPCLLDMVSLHLYHQNIREQLAMVSKAFLHWSQAHGCEEPNPSQKLTLIDLLIEALHTTIRSRILGTNISAGFTARAMTWAAALHFRMEGRECGVRRGLLKVAS